MIQHGEQVKRTSRAVGHQWLRECGEPPANYHRFYLGGRKIVLGVERSPRKGFHPSMPYNRQINIRWE